MNDIILNQIYFPALQKLHFTTLTEQHNTKPNILPSGQEIQRDTISLNTYKVHPTLTVQIIITQTLTNESQQQPNYKLHSSPKMCVRELQICKFCAKTKEVIELCEKLKEKPDEIAAAKDYLSCPQLARSDLKETQVDGKAL